MQADYLYMLCAPAPLLCYEMPLKNRLQAKAVTRFFYSLFYIQIVSHKLSYTIALSGPDDGAVLLPHLPVARLIGDRVLCCKLLVDVHAEPWRFIHIHIAFL